MNVPQWKRDFRLFTGSPRKVRRRMKRSARAYRKAARLAVRRGQEPPRWQGLDERDVA